MIVDCNWIAWNLDWTKNSCVGSENVRVIWHPEYQKCYTFSAPDRFFSFEAVFYIGNFPLSPIDYYKLDYTAPMALGVFVLVHAPGSPTDMSRGVFAGPGTQLSATVTMANILRMTEPYGNCTDQVLLALTEPNNPYLYDRNACQSLCRQRLYAALCGCLVTYEMWTARQIVDMNYHYCNRIANFSIGDNESVVDPLRTTK